MANTKTKLISVVGTVFLLAAVSVAAWSFYGPKIESGQVPVALAQSDSSITIGLMVEDLSKEEIPVKSYSFSLKNSGSSGSATGSGRVEVQNIHITMDTNKSSPLLMQAGLYGKRLKKAVLTVRRAGKTEVEKWLLSDVLISSYKTTATSGSGLLDELDLAFQKFDNEYMSTDGGSTKSSWDGTRAIK